MLYFTRMGVLLPSERTTRKGRFCLAIVYSLLALGGLTMVYPFLVMIAASFSGPYDYHRHSPMVRALWDDADRFMRSISAYVPRFPREVFPDAPAAWGSWLTVARDAEGVRRFAAEWMEPARTNEATFLEWKSRAEAFRARTLAHDINYTTCAYDPRDVAPFVESQATLDEINRTWPVRYRSFFDISFTAESKISLGHASWKPPRGDPKYEMWLKFKDSYRQRMVEDGDYICRTLPFPLVGTNDAAEVRAALAVQFVTHGRRDFWRGATANYRLVGQYLFLRGRAFGNTVLLVLLTILAHLTVNPLAAYALSRFRLRGTEQILLFLLATMAFPAAVTAIPGFLLVRDLGLLNTLAALVLPTVASGMSIFILKGFFDALPRELYEAAAIDGAGEWTIFRRITLPMTTPILAVNALNSFIAAYNSWEWAFLVCQNESNWTLAVWMYQMSQQMGGQPWCVMAGFVLVSIPTAVVFLACQKVILRGIVLPSMK
ncbi:MAG: carbohydrate ABC transporter permease [Kiritimatiellae bacterium]|nr:carbohydrate ABC transporter permease [Kiritimatiellia bacterium]